ncbi:pentatricopeptide repeat-containing protein At5g48910-like [Phalaenopsis equestris]|uniref:pentatricopeptide repeat-containing protein At5g48910-like n=1 Tax=Phalaenopsis equestris TaxID=78828 RepID=UPI0009E4AAEB|nr:pentatricopeptide repeat-containing protein At5g48910-like [Phalaenopsis equestris]
MPLFSNAFEDHIASLIQKCPGMKTLRQIHGRLLRNHILSSSPFTFTLSKIISFCALSPNGDIHYAQRVFDDILQPNVFSWNSMIRGFSQVQNQSSEPIALYRKMLSSGFANPNSFTLAFVLKACSNISALSEGRQVHSHAYKYGLDSSPFVQTGLLNFYAKCEELASARFVFCDISDKNLIAWSAMISGYARIGMVNEALGLFREMQEAGLSPDEVTMVSVISACAKAGALDLGRWVHSFVDRKGIRADLVLSTALIDMYAKCGLIEKAKKVFDDMVERDTMAWSTMIVGFATHGLVDDALKLFSRMLDSKVEPNHVTFLGVLSACAHSGIVRDGRRFWSAMHDSGVQPLMEHYGCMVDLLCRAGLFEEAYSFVRRMPFPPNAVIWRTLLAGCKKNEFQDKEAIIAEHLLRLEPLNAENYVLLSNIYALRSHWDKVSKMRKKMKDNGVRVIPGCSSIEIDGFVHKFIVSDDSHPEMKQIREALKGISRRVRLSGHLPWTSSVLHDVDEEEKENALCEHSERLAVAFGLIKTRTPTVIRVVKNLRFCADCHEVIKIISKEYGREIIVRDRVRFHRFVSGTCSCNDFW